MEENRSLLRGGTELEPVVVKGGDWEGAVAGKVS
jgi:hypothetical protein